MGLLSFGFVDQLQTAEKYCILGYWKYVSQHLIMAQWIACFVTWTEIREGPLEFYQPEQFLHSYLWQVYSICQCFVHTFSSLNTKTIILEWLKFDSTTLHNTIRVCFGDKMSLIL